MWVKKWPSVLAANKSGKGKIASQPRCLSFFPRCSLRLIFIEKFAKKVTWEIWLSKRSSQETSVFVTGIVKEDERSKFCYELISQISKYRESNDYPITPKEHGTDFLMDNRHLWLRSRKQSIMMQIRLKRRTKTNQDSLCLVVTVGLFHKHQTDPRTK